MADEINITTIEMAGRNRAGSGSAWEAKMGYSRAIRVGNTIAVTGTVGVNSDGSYAPKVGDQARRSLKIIRAALESLGGSIDNVIRTRIYVTDVSKWEEVAAVHGEVFRSVRPATTIVEVAKLIDKDAQIEIEADAIVD